MFTTIYSLTYSQNGNDAADGPSIADFWLRENAEKALASMRQKDCVVTPREVPESYAEMNCED